MNKYGQLAQNHWQSTDPTRYAQLENPTEFFTELGDEVLAAVDSLASQMESQERQTIDSSTQASYLDTVGRLNAIRKQAEEVVLADLVWITPSSELDEESQRPSPERVAELLDQLQDREQEMSTEEFEEERTRLLGLHPAP